MYNIYIHYLYTKRNTVAISDGNALLKIGVFVLSIVDRAINSIYIHACLPK